MTLKFAHPIILLGVLAAGSATAQTCEKKIQFDNAQVKEGMTVLRNNEAEELDRIFAFEEMMCAARDTVRGAAMNAAAKSSSEALREAALRERMASRDSFIVNLVDDGNLTEEAATYIRENRSLSYQVQKKAPEFDCFVLFRSGRSPSCSGGRIVDQSGTSVSLQYDGLHGDFQLAEDGKLRGYIVPEDGQLKIPAEMDIF